MVTKLTKMPIVFLGVTLPKNTIVCWDSYEGLYYLIKRMPNFYGNPRRLQIEALFYDPQNGDFGSCVLKGRISFEVFRFWERVGRPAPVYPERINFASVMQDAITKKKGKGAMKSFPDSVLTDALRWNEGSELAHGARIG